MKPETYYYSVASECREDNYIWKSTFSDGMIVDRCLSDMDAEPDSIYLDDMSDRDDYDNVHGDFNNWIDSFDIEGVKILTEDELMLEMI